MPTDAAALPSPPDIPPWKGGTRPYSVGGNIHSKGQVTRPGSGSYQNGNGNGSPVTRPIFPNIKDLQDQAALLNVNETTPLEVLLGTAAEAIDLAKKLADSQPDQAYVQYLRASEITVNTIPHHPDYRSTTLPHPGWSKEFAALMMAVRTKQATMDTIKQEILEDNIRTNVQPAGTFTMTSPGQNDSTAPRGRENRNSGTNSMRMPSPTQFQSQPIPDSQTRVKRNSVPAEDLLAQRFAKLRASQSHDNGPDSNVQPTHPSSGPAGQASAYTAYSSNTPPVKLQCFSRPADSPSTGPSDFLSQRPSHVPPTPPTVRSTRFPRNLRLTPPRTSTESTRSITQRYSHFGNSPRGSPSRGFDDSPYRSRTPNGVHSARETRSNSPDLPYTTAITAQSLLEYLRTFNVLLVDVRSRDQFDNGHVYAKSIICIEPVSLKENVSAEELEDRLVVSPEYELSLFERRNEFDLIVYYDQNTTSVSYLAGPPAGTSAPHLRALHDTLYEFNEYKPLKAGRPPALLLGGLDAWIDILGQQSLATSSTAAVMGSIQNKRPISRPGRPLGRVPTMASANSSLEVRKRRLREFTPLNSEELSAWMERSKNEEIDTSHYLEEEPLTEEPQEESMAEEPAPFVHNYEDFLRRFPEPHHVQQSMTRPESKPAPPMQSFPAPIPSTPSRPPPAVPRPSYSGVSEGRQIQPHLERQNSATRTALYMSNSLLRRLKLPRTGLTNFGVTCYMNSTIQCLSATSIMSKFFIDNRFRGYVQKNWKGSQGVMPGLYANLIRSLWKDDVEVIMPSSFRNFCGRLNREWAIDRQQDAKEFFDFVVDCLHEDLNVNWQRTPLRPLTFPEEMQRERMPVQKVSRIEWDRYCHREESFISSLFAGQHASRLRCTTCRQTSTTYEAFYSISVEIPPTGSADIYQCLRSYCKEEMLSGDEVWKCPHCKCKRMATKQIFITRAPQILVVHFKRFSASKTQSARKIHTPIEFPLHGLRMDEFLISHGASAPPPDMGVPPPMGATDPPFSYDAFGVLRHIGSSMGSGHYISLVRDAERHCWRRFDDERAGDFNPRDLRARDRLQNEQAYIVFYERVPAK
ncbi:hypothetical protein N7481_006198 [Penicillium waksmanii]|uniref:uncharacterized protein n=1 Tax=Penicillium waksmanii TaxID=69791 RepID=UPI00254838A9|nr:uncharacterized protein N7481_006198 [Penicillium waksmanii]KAJ5984099.1 hypothetical protein N7481_006198 [Penicillium waksmanii]